MAAPTSWSYLSQADSAALDAELMSPEHGFSLDQLMELAGLSVACAVAELSPPCRVLVLAGPGNNGGDGLVAARHLHHFGFSCSVCLPREVDKPLFVGLKRQLVQLSVPFLSVDEVLSLPLHGRFDVILDALFGFSFSGSPRPPFDALLAALASQRPLPLLVSVDLPSGWSVEEGDVDGKGIRPDALVSLTAPKKGVRGFEGTHFLGGRFVPPAIRERYHLHLPAYPGAAQCVRLS